MEPPLIRDIPEIFNTKVTRIKEDLYGCRVIKKDTGRVVVECQVPRILIQPAFQDIFRTLDKMGHISPMAHSSRWRPKPENGAYREGMHHRQFKVYWGGKPK